MGIDLGHYVLTPDYYSWVEYVPWVYSKDYDPSKAIVDLSEFVDFHNMKLLPKTKPKKYSAGTMPRRGYNYTIGDAVSV